MRTQILGVVVGAILGLVIAQACASIQDQEILPDIDGQCATVCTAIASANCWDSRGVEQLLGPAVEIVNCYDRCQSKSQFGLAIDFDCLKTADACTALDRCIKSGYKGSIQPAAWYSSPSQAAGPFFIEDKMADLHDRIADGFAEADGVAEDLYKQFTSRYADLISNTKNRDDKMWKNLGAPIELTIGMLELVPIQKRMASDEWTASMTAIIAASRRQAFIETMIGTLLSVRDKNIEPTIAAAKRMSRSELKSAAKVPDAAFRSAAERRKSARV